MSSETKGHTEGVAKLFSLNGTVEVRSLSSPTRTPIAAWPGFDDAHRSPEAHEANARRIVALWNMAHRLGLSTDAVEQGAVERLVQAVHGVMPFLPRDPDASGYDERVRTLTAALKPFAEVGHAG